MLFERDEEYPYNSLLLTGNSASLPSKSFCIFLVPILRKDLGWFFKFSSLFIECLIINLSSYALVKIIQRIDTCMFLSLEQTVDLREGEFVWGSLYTPPIHTEIMFLFLEQITGDPC